MHITDRLLSIIQELQGSEITGNFISHYEKTGYSFELRKPLLDHKTNFSSRTSRFVQNIDSVDFSRIKRLSIYNNTSRESRIRIKANFDAHSLEECFDLFVRCTSHSNPIGDFRTNPTRFRPILQSLRYFLFHGDGNCLLLSLLFKALVHRIIEEDIKIYYCCSEKREFMHVYGMKGNQYFDVDQKTQTIGIPKEAPYGMIYQLMSMAGADLFFKISEKSSWLFSKMTCDYFHQYRNPSQPLIYRKSPKIINISEGFEKARAFRNENVCIAKDDYEWKSQYREILLEKFDEKFEISLNSCQNLTIGFQSDDPPEVLDLATIFYGRIPLRFDISVDSIGNANFPIHDLPWMIVFPPDVTSVSINGKAFNPHLGKQNQHRIIGARDLDKIGIQANDVIKLKSLRASLFSIYFPFNALALNSGVLDFDIPNDLEIFSSY